MLVLKVRRGQSTYLTDSQGKVLAEFKVFKRKGNRFQVGIEADIDLKIVRTDDYEKGQAEEREARTVERKARSQ